MPRFTQQDAQRIAAQINQNVADVDAGRITWAEFGNRNRAAWDEVAQGQLNIIGSACDRRHGMVHKALNVNEQTANVAGVPSLMRDYVRV